MEDEQLVEQIEEQTRSRNSIKISEPNMVQKKYKPHVQKMEKGKTYMIEILKAVTVCQATKTPGKSFDLNKGDVVLGVFDITTVTGRDSVFMIEELGDYVGLPAGTFRAELGE